MRPFLRCSRALRVESIAFWYRSLINSAGLADRTISSKYRFILNLRSFLRLVCGWAGCQPEDKLRRQLDDDFFGAGVDHAHNGKVSRPGERVGHLPSGAE